MEDIEFLEKVREEIAYIEILEQQVEQIRKSLLPSAIRYDQDRVQTSPSDPMVKAIVRIDEVTMEIQEEIERYADDIRKARGIIARLPSRRHRGILTAVYLCPANRTFEEAAAMTHYSLAQAKRDYAGAVEALEKMSRNEPE